jgi:hypothetical protein
MIIVPLSSWRQEIIVGIATRLRAGRSVVPSPVRARGFSLLHNVQTGSDVHPDSQVMGTRFISRRIILITHIGTEDKNK